MNQTEIVLQLNKEQNHFYKEQLGHLFPDNNGVCSRYDEYLEDIAEDVDDDDYLLAGSYLAGLSNAIYLDQSQFFKVQLKDNKLQKITFAKHAWCAYHAVKIRSELGRIQNKMNRFFQSGNYTLWWSSLLFCEWYSEADEVMTLALQSTNDNKLGIMGKGGNPFDSYSFYLLELYSLWKGLPFDRSDYHHSALVENNSLIGFIYDEPLKYWNTNDLQMVDELVFKMADYHISKTEEILPDDKDQDRYYEFSDPNIRLYPFEILAWIKIRELSGLQNPKKFTHPLMNLPLAEPITDYPLKKPTDLTEVEQLLALVRKHFPEANI